MSSVDAAPSAQHFEEVVRARFGRRTALKAMLVVGGGAAAGTAIASPASAAFVPGELTFDPLPLNTNDQVSVATGFQAPVLISWGDPVVAGAPAFDVANQTPASQSKQFGFNNDYVDFKPLPYGSNNSTHGLLWVNHEYTSANMMFPGVTANNAAATTAQQKLTEIEAHGASIVEVTLDTATNTWSYDPNSAYNRRITGSTPMTITGPCAGNVHLRTAADPTGTTVHGMLNNCGGGYTPWGTVLTAEENFDQYFAKRGALVADTPEKQYAAANASVFGIPAAGSGRGFELVDTRFDMTVEWNEPFRFGWIIEVDPYDAASTPKKRTAMGRFKHEAAAGITAGNGQYVAYLGDDQGGQFIYKFVTSGTVNPADRASNMNLLDSGTLYVATFLADGTGTWSPLTFGTGPLTAANGYEDQADVLIRCRIAAAALGGTPMDRPEDVEVNPTSGYIYAAMTGTTRATGANAANPRLSGIDNPNSSLGGHVIEIRETGGDHTSLTFAWEMFMLCGAPNAGGSLDAATVPAAANASGRTYYAGFDESQVSPISRPDNVAFDTLGNLWITTDGMPSAATSGGLGMNDTVYGVPTAGPERGHLKALCTGPKGAEMTGPYFTADDTTLFVAVQHPGEDGNNLAPQSTWNAVTTASPASTISRNAVLAIRRVNGTSIPNGTVDPDPVVPEFPVPALAVGTAAAVGGALYWRQQRMNNRTQPAT